MAKIICRWMSKSTAAAVCALVAWLAFVPSARSAQHILRVRALGDPQTLDWNRAHTWMDSLLLYNLMEGLVGLNEKNEPIPALAEKWTISPDHRTFTFYLRKNVVWSDGVKLTAQHFVDSWRRLLTPATGAKYAHFLFDIENASEYFKGSVTDFSKVGIQSDGDNVIRVRLKAPIAYWHLMLTSYVTFPIRTDLIQATGNGWDRPGKMVTLGPFLFSAYEPGRSILLKRNPSYYGATSARGRVGNLDEIAIALAHDDATALRLFEVGQLDWLAKISPLERKRLVKRPEFKTWSELRTVHLAFNVNKGPMQNPVLRRAVAMSIDRRKLDQLLEGTYRPATSFVPPGILGYSAKAELAFNPAQAKQELKAAGLDATKLPPLDLLTVSFDDQVIAAQFVQEELKRNLGLTVRTHFLEPKRYYSPTLNHDDYSMQINLWGADFPDPDNFYSVFLSDSKLSRYRWSDKKYDDLVMEARTLGKSADRVKKYQAAQKILLGTSAVTLPLYYGRISALLRPNVQGFNPGPLTWWEFKKLSLK